MAWRLAQSLTVLREEVNRRWPNRSKVSDGTIGDTSHASRSNRSDHNPFIIVDGVGVVRAMDITANGIDADAYAERLRELGKARDPRLNPGGYVIWNKRIASERQNWAWRRYTGANGHTHHIHLSVSTNRSGFDAQTKWGIDRVGRPQEAPDPNRGRRWQQFAAGATDALIYRKGGRNDQIAELELLLGRKPTGTYSHAIVQEIVAFKKAAGNPPEWGIGSIVTAALMDALRGLAAKP